MVKMLTRENLIEKLEKNNRSTDTEILEIYLKNWRIDPVYEDESGIEYFDDMAVAKLNQGIILKEQGTSDTEILSILNKEIKNVVDNPVTPTRKVNLQTQDKKELKLENVTVDLTSHTLVLLAETIAQKISNDISEKIKENGTLQPSMDAGKLKRDNEILAGQVEKLLEENKKLVSQINTLIQEKAKYKKAFGSFYFKQE